MSKRTADEAIAPLKVKRSKSEKSTLSLTDLHDDYLELIFKWLQLKELLAVLQSTKHFEQVIVSIIRRHYAKEWLKISFYEYDLRTTDPDVLVLNDMVSILPFLRCFGSSTSKLMVRFLDEKEPQALAIEGYILKFCDELKELSLDYCRKGAFDDIEKPFQQMEVIRFYGGHLGKNISNFNKWFPKLRSLNISQVDIANKYCIEETMPSLEHMAVSNGAASKPFSKRNIDGSIRYNPQLRSYSMNAGCRARDLRFVSSWLKQLEKLDFWIHPQRFKKGCVKPIIFEEVKELAISIDDDEDSVINLFERDSTEKHRLVCPKLEQLGVQCYHLNVNYLDFACGNNLKKLTLHCQYHDGPSIEFLTKYASHWPNLTEVTIQVDGLSADDIVKFLEFCQHLQRLNISAKPYVFIPKIEELKAKLPPDWKAVSMITKCFYYNFKDSIIRQTNIV